MRILVMLLVLSGFLSSCVSETQSSTLVTPEEMKELMQLDSVQLIDVRSLQEFRDGHLKDAQNLVYDEDFIEKITKLDKSKPVAVYCRTGRRSKECSQILKEAGFRKIYELEGGLSQWEFEIEHAEDSISE